LTPATAPDDHPRGRRGPVVVAARSVSGGGAMPAKNDDLHGNVPDTSAVALILIDVINDLEWEDAEELQPFALPMAERLAALKARAKAAGIAVIYANDNFGRWRSDMGALIEHCLHPGRPGKPMVELLKPEPDDYFVLKPKHSAFFSSTLETLLIYLQSTTVILTGVAGNICVLFSANDAYMRDFYLHVPADCVASNSIEENHHALAQMASILKADITASADLDLPALIRAAEARRPSHARLPSAQRLSKRP
jgi:nicotinamidase-related amidase